MGDLAFTLIPFLDSFNTFKTKLSRVKVWSENIRVSFFIKKKKLLTKHHHHSRGQLHSFYKNFFYKNVRSVVLEGKTFL